jgi:hypothetical protein
MTQQQRNQPQNNDQSQNENRNDEQQSQSMALGNALQHIPVKEQPETSDDPSMPPTNDAGDAISEGSLYDASGAATGGGVDTPDAVEESTEDEVRKQKRSHIHQGTSAYMGGGADNGSNL